MLPDFDKGIKILLIIVFIFSCLNLLTLSSHLRSKRDNISGDNFSLTEIKNSITGKENIDKQDITPQLIARMEFTGEEYSQNIKDINSFWREPQNYREEEESEEKKNSNRRERPEIILRAVSQSKDKDKVILASINDEQSYILGKGEKIGDYYIEQIKAGKVILSRGEESFEVNLEDE